MRKVFINAYTNFNLGDDLFIKVLCERYPETKFILYGPNEYKISFKKITNLKIVPNDTYISRGMNYIFRSIKNNFTLRSLLSKRSDLGVYIGGSIFMQQGNWQRTFTNLKDMHIQNKPFFIIGANFGPFNNKEFYNKHKRIFKDFTDICFRDRYSYELFKDLVNVRQAADVIFQLDTSKAQKNQQQESHIVISVIKPSIRKYLVGYDNIYYEKIKDIAIHFIEKGYKITLMSFCENEGDKEAVETITDLIPKDYLKKVTKHSYKLNMEETLDIIARSSFVVGTRFHAMILGWVYNKPVFPIAYSKKMTNVMKDINFKGSFTDFENIHKIQPEQVYNSMKTNSIDVTEQIINAEKQFKKLDEYLLR